MTLIDNWKSSGKLWSVQWAVAAVLINLAIALLPMAQEKIGFTLYSVINAALGIALIISRVLSQTPKPKDL